MVYQWNGYKPPVSAYDAAQEFAAIEEEKGSVQPADVVDRARPEDSILHKCFEWNDAVAAEKYRENQAGSLIRALVVTQERENRDPVSVRAYMNISDQDGSTRKGIFINAVTAFQHEESRDIVLQRAMRELQAFRKKYQNLQEFSELFPLVDELMNVG